jgi:hypothetical protein
MKMTFQIIALFITVLFAQVSYGQENPHKLIAPSLVYLEYEFTPTLGRNAQQKMKSQGTGFIISDDGLALTSFHIFEGAFGTQPINQSLKSSVGGTANLSPTDIIDTNRALDFALVKVKVPAVGSLKAVTLGRVYEARDVTVHTSGFHGSQPFQFDGRIAGDQGPPGLSYLWALNLNVTSGQSGSPVYLSNGTVVGLLKGNLKETTGENIGDVSYMVPIDFADGLIASQRLRQLESRMTMLEAIIGSQNKTPSSPLQERVSKVENSIGEISRQFAWNVNLEGPDLVVDYKKLISGDPLVEKIGLKVTPIIFVANTNSYQQNFDLPLQDEYLMKIDAQLQSARLVVSDIAKFIKSQEESARGIKIVAIKIYIYPFLGVDKLDKQERRLEIDRGGP